MGNNTPQSIHGEVTDDEELTPVAIHSAASADLLMHGKALQSAIAPEWRSSAMYASGEYATYCGRPYRSKAGANSGHVPPTSPSHWESAVLTSMAAESVRRTMLINSNTEYMSGDTRIGEDGIIYTCTKDHVKGKWSATSGNWGAGYLTDRGGSLLGRLTIGGNLHMQGSGLTVGNGDVGTVTVCGKTQSTAYGQIVEFADSDGNTEWLYPNNIPVATTRNALPGKCVPYERRTYSAGEICHATVGGLQGAYVAKVDIDTPHAFDQSEWAYIGDIASIASSADTAVIRDVNTHNGRNCVRMATVNGVDITYPASKAELMVTPSRDRDLEMKGLSAMLYRGTDATGELVSVSGCIGSNPVMFDVDWGEKYYAAVGNEAGSPLSGVSAEISHAAEGVIVRYHYDYSPTDVKNIVTSFRSNTAEVERLLLGETIRDQYVDLYGSDVYDPLICTNVGYYEVRGVGTRLGAKLCRKKALHYGFATHGNREVAIKHCDYYKTYVPRVNEDVTGLVSYFDITVEVDGIARDAVYVESETAFVNQGEGYTYLYDYVYQIPKTLRGDGYFSEFTKYDVACSVYLYGSAKWHNCAMQQWLNSGDIRFNFNSYGYRTMPTNFPSIPYRIGCSAELLRSISEVRHYYFYFGKLYDDYDVFYLNTSCDMYGMPHGHSSSSGLSSDSYWRNMCMAEGYESPTNNGVNCRNSECHLWLLDSVTDGFGGYSVSYNEKLLSDGSIGSACPYQYDEDYSTFGIKPCCVICSDYA